MGGDGGGDGGSGETGTGRRSSKVNFFLVFYRAILMETNASTRPQLWSSGQLTYASLALSTFNVDSVSQAYRLDNARMA